MEKKEIIERLYFCAGQCERCHYACHREKDNDKLERCMMLDQDCADICRLTGQLLERDSENVDSFIKLCGEMCMKCADECEKHAHMEHCENCAEACRKCSEICLVYFSAKTAA